jgi:hypothetical protein
VSASSPANDPDTDKRRSTRVVQAIPVTVRGIDALGQAFKETTTTVMVNCNGCKYRSKHYVPKNSRVTIEILSQDKAIPARIVPARVVWVQRPRTFRDIFQVALEFEVPGNVWGIDPVPEDWFPHPDDENLEVPVTEGLPEIELEQAEPREYAQAPTPSEPVLPAPTLYPTYEDTLPDLKAQPENAKTITLPVVSRERESEHAAARQMVAEAVEATMSVEIAKMRERLETLLQESVKETVKSLAESIAEATIKDLVLRASDRTADVVVEARKACLGNAVQLDEKIRLALQEVVNTKAAPQKVPAAKRKKKGKKAETEPVAS